MSDRTDFLHPDYEPGEFDQIERRLRQALAGDAQQLHPSHRLDAILHEAHEAGPVTATGGSGTRRWMMPLAAAAAVAAIIGGVWWSNQGESPTITPPATSGPTQSPAPSPTGSATGTGTPTSSPTAGGPVTTETVSLPVYFVGPVGDEKPTYKLYRDFIRSELPTGATPANKAKAALVLAMNAQPYSNTDGYLQPWSGQTIGDVKVTDTLITVDLANAGSQDAVVGEENKRLAVQELVWTAQAAVQKGNLPVKFTVQGGADRLFGSISTDKPFTRPPAAESWRDLAPIWVTSPARDQVFPASTSVKVTGEATVFEANMSWELTKGGTQVRTGNTMASIGAPGRGTYAITLGRLSPGPYTIRVFELSAMDGQHIAAERSVSFTVE